MDAKMPYMTPEEIEAFRPDRLAEAGECGLERARQAMMDAGCWSHNQQMGSRWPIGCVALEITQRCNLDCTLCYLSEHSEAVRDIPLGEVFRRIDLIHAYYGPGTDVQITGGDPTLRAKGELLSIVRRVRDLGMRPTLMTNGKRASRALIEDLAEAGLMDIAFHVDTTQQVKGYRTEAQLSELRQVYIERTRGLPLSVMFNTTIHAGNFHEIPDLVRFFAGHAGAVRTAAFQLQADTGRGVWRQREAAITIETAAEKIREGAGTPVNFDASRIGHPSCSRYGMTLAVNGQLHDLFDDEDFIARMQTATAHLTLDRKNAGSAARRFIGWLVVNPSYLVPCLRWAGGKLWRMKGELWAARGRAATLSFVIHNFMDACSLERERINACVFKTMTGEGPLSMCLHNAKRDDYILKPVEVQLEGGKKYWQPLTGELDDAGAAAVPVSPGSRKLSLLKGRPRRNALERRRQNRSEVSSRAGR